MKINRIKDYGEDSKMKVNFLEETISRLKEVDYFLDYLDKKKIGDLDKYILELRNRFLENAEFRVESLDLREISKDFLFLNKDDDIFKVALSFYLSTLDCKEFRINGEIEICKKDILRGFLHIKYHLAKSLLSIMCKEEAFKFFNDYIDYHTVSIRKPSPVENLEDLLYSSTDWPELFQKSFNLIDFQIDKGQVGYKIEKCKWHEAIKEFNDPDFCYSIACHYDFLAAKVMNENFVLTRTQTLAGGGKCCDFVWHDMRYDRECMHPDEKFWANL
ncbi:MAG: L-2-amino-thiazoline-4-carboxylic acid hydrolase [Pseudomonadota bacterium]